MRVRSSSASTVVACLFATVVPLSGSRAETYSWSQFVAGGLEARSISEQVECPSAAIDGATAAMTVRAAPGKGYPVTVCALPVPAKAKSVTVGGAALPLPALIPKRIAVVGDTGCRLKGIYIQACNDPVQWPLKQISAAIAAMKPDLVIHVGDYHYRETACPAGEAGCAKSPFGDTWDVWREDFFSPMASLLQTAPWVMVRGNHEDCNRGGQGWSRAIEAAPFDTAKLCNRPSPPFVVQLPQVALAVVDTATAPEPTVDQAQVALFKAQYGSIANSASGPIWVLQHRPIWSTGGTVAGLPFGDNKTLALAALGTLPSRVQMILSGHHHIFQVLSYVEDLPIQVVVGHGGDYLNQGKSANPTGWNINGMTIKAGVHQLGQFGFAMLEPQDDGWVITNYDQTGKALQRCGLKGREAGCIKD